MKKIVFDMDGTIADLYSVENWLFMLRAEDTTPYDIAKPMLNMSLLARQLNKLQALGIALVIVSWGSLNSTEKYLAQTEYSKKKWLKRHLPSVKFDEINIVPFGCSKSNFADTDSILFDDNEEIRNEFIGTAYEPKDIFKILKEIEREVQA